MEIWAVANQKGGVGKTTTAVTLAGLLSPRRYRVLLVDLDPHGSLTSYFGLDPDQIEKSVFQLFQQGGGMHVAMATLLHKTGVAGVYLLPASRALATLDRHISGRDGMGLVLLNALRQCQNQFHHAIVDCPPVFGVLMLNALAACRTLVIPVQTEYLALKGLERMLNTLEMVVRSSKRPVDYLVVPTLYDQRTRASRGSLEALRHRYPSRLWPGVIPVDTKFRDASLAGQPLPLMTPGARGAAAYEALLEFMLERGNEAGMAGPRAMGMAVPGGDADRSVA